MVQQSGKKRDESDGSIQTILFFIAILFGIFIWELPSPWDTFSFILGEVAIGVVVIWIGSLSMRANLIARQHDARVIKIAGQDDPLATISIPPLRVFLIRNSFNVVGVLLGWAIIWGVTLGLLSVTSDAVRDSISKEMRYIWMMLIIPPVVMALYGSAAALEIIGTIVDYHLYPNTSIQHLLYATPDVSPLTFTAIWKHLRSILAIGGAYVLLMGVYAVSMIGLGKIDLDAELPSGSYYICIGSMALLGILSLWWLSRMSSPDQIKKRVLNAAEKTYGAGSEEYNDAQKLVEQQTNSLEQQANRRMGQLFLGILALFTALMFVFIVLINAINVSGTLRQGLAIGFLVLCGVGFFLVYSRTASRLNIQFPDEAKKLDEAMQKGDYETAKHYADLLSQKMPVIEANTMAAYPYWLSGDIAKGKALAQEGLAAALAREEKFRNPAQVARYLWYIGAMQIIEEDYDGALESLNRAIHYNASDLGIYGNLAETLLSRNTEPDKALEYINKQFALNEQLPAAMRSPLNTGRLLKAWALTRLGDHKTADVLIKEAFERVNRNNIPVMGEMNYLAAQIAFARRDIGSAHEYLQRVLAVDPNGLYAQLARKLLKE